MGIQKDYQKILSELKKELQLTNIMQVPQLIKIVVNVGLGEALVDHKVIEKVAYQLSLLTGQKPQSTRGRRSIASFKLRAGEVIGLKVTLRGKRMYDFFEKLVRIVLPRIRDFRGISLSGFDGHGNYNLGLSEMSVFPEIDYGKLDKSRGLEVTLVTSAGNDRGGHALLTKLGMPFEKEGKTASRK